MRLEKLDLLENVGNTYDQTRTTIQGRISQKNIGGVEVLGPQTNKFIDVFNDTSGAVTPGLLFLSDSGRLFVAANVPTNSSIFGVFYDTLPIALYDIDFNTGNTVYIGRIDVLLPNQAATVHTLRSFKVYNDSTNSGWRLIIVTTASVLINGGVFLANNINKTDFAPIGFATIPMATGNNQKAVYFLQDPNNIGANQLNIASVGSVLNRNTGTLYVHNGVSATHQYYLYNTGITNLLMDVRTVDVSASSPGVVTDVGHSFNNNDPVVFTAGPLPTGLTVGTVYFVRNPTATSYNLSLTSGGANINTSGSPTVGATITRAFGTTSSGWIHKTGNLPALTGALLNNDSEDFATPQHTLNSGEDCAFFATASNLYLGRLSELTDGTTVWPSLITANQLGAPGDIINVNATVAAWSNSLDRSLFTSGNSRFVLKRVISNEIDDRFGLINISQLEGSPANDEIDFGANSITNIDFELGWLAINSIAVGQRGVFLKDVRADFKWEESYIVTKVLNVNNIEIRGAFLFKELSNSTVGLRLFYRTSGFTSITGGWTQISLDKDFSIPLSAQIQFKIMFRVNGRRSNIPQQVNELFLKLNDINEISANWEYTHDDSNPATNTVAYRLKRQYISSVPNLRHTVRDLSGTLLANNTTSLNPSFFQYSTDGGVNWNNLGTIPNVVGTLVRYVNTSLPNQELRPALQEA